MFLEILQNSQENTCARSLFFKYSCRLQLYQKRDSGTCIFLVNFAKLIRTPFLQNTSGRLLLSKSFLNWLCLYLLFLVNSSLSFLYNFSIDLKVWGYPTWLILWFINFKTNRMGSTKWSYHKGRSFASDYLIFFKNLFQINNLV